MVADGCPLPSGFGPAGWWDSETCPRGVRISRPRVLRLCLWPQEDPATPGPPFPLSSLGPVCARMSSWAWMTHWPSVLPSSPFDADSFLVSPSPIGKFSVGSRRGSLYNWTPPSTPSFRERYYLVRARFRQGCCGNTGCVCGGGNSPGTSLWGWAEQRLQRKQALGPASLV